MTSIRVTGIDFWRTIGAFFIILLHADYGDLSADKIVLIKETARWALPFFFMVSGSFLSRKTNDEGLIPFGSIRPTIVRLILIQVVTSVVYILSEFAFNGYLNLRLKFLLTGACFHLWYIGALIVGYLSVWLLINLRRNWIIGLIASGILIIAILADGYDLYFKKELPFSLFRFFLGIPLMYIGYIFSKYKLSGWMLFGVASCAILGLFIQHFEAVSLFNQFGIQPSERQFLFGSLVMSVAIFSFANNWRIKDNFFSEIGAKYSLLIYLYHPLIFLFLRKSNLWRFNQNTYSMEMYSPLLVFLLSLSIAVLLFRKFPVIYLLLNGDKSRWIQVIRMQSRVKLPEK